MLREQLHVTLAFLAEVPERALDDLEARLERAAKRRTAFATALVGGGAFPNVGRARVLWTGLDLDDPAAYEMARLATGARAAASKAGVAVDGARFKPHVTVARLKHPQEATSWVRLLDAYRGPAWTVAAVDLVASYLGEGPRKRPRYETVASFPLGSPVNSPHGTARLPRCAPPSHASAGTRMKIAVAAETRDGESRVAMVPELVGKLTALGYDVAVEPGAGMHALLSDDEYVEAGATIADDAIDDRRRWSSRCSRSSVDRIRRLRRGAATISFLPTTTEQDVVVDLRDCGITAFAMELVPRISRAQSMDALSSQALVAGYRCAIVAAGMLRRFFPLNMTAAGTVQPAEVVVLGAGVAGLQAIATAKRLGAVVRAYDVRAAAAEEIRSMGAKSIDLELETLEGTGGYAREMTEDRAARQRDLLTPYIAAADALITTAAVPGRTAPMLVTAAMVEQMKPGSVVVDLAAETGGNVEGSVAGRGRPDRQRPGVGRAQRAVADARARRRGSTPRTSSTS